MFFLAELKWREKHASSALMERPRIENQCWKNQCTFALLLAACWLYCWREKNAWDFSGKLSIWLLIAMSSMNYFGEKKWLRRLQWLFCFWKVIAWTLRRCWEQKIRWLGGLKRCKQEFFPASWEERSLLLRVLLPAFLITDLVSSYWLPFSSSDPMLKKHNRYFPP